MTSVATDVVRALTERQQPLPEGAVDTDVLDGAAVNRDVLKGTANTPQAGQALPSLFPLHPVGPGVGTTGSPAPSSGSDGNGVECAGARCA